MSRQPNIVLVLPDQMRAQATGYAGDPNVITPNLDKLYTQSTRFTDFHVSPTCAPTRSALMSGRVPFKNGVTHTILERDKPFFSSLLMVFDTLYSLCTIKLEPLIVTFWGRILNFSIK